VPGSDPEPLLLNNETVLVNGQPVGRVKSGNYGHTIGRSCGIARIRSDVPLDRSFTFTGYTTELLTFLWHRPPPGRRLHRSRVAPTRWCAAAQARPAPPHGGGFRRPPAGGVGLAGDPVRDDGGSVRVVCVGERPARGGTCVCRRPIP
jgi:hypothetical protein